MFLLNVKQSIDLFHNENFLFLKDGHRLLGYKILCGHVWAYEHCPQVRHVAKSDDNVEVDMDTLVTRLTGDTETDWQDLITGPTVCFGMPVIRSSKGGMRSTLKEEEFDRDWIPVFCVGFLSLSSPQAVYGESPEELEEGCPVHRGNQ